jgi:phytoene desaturase
MDKKIAVIGAGLGGLSAASRLANQGFEVHLFEQNSYPGGKAAQLIKDGFRFDKGPSLLTMPQVIEDLFNECNENLQDYLQLKKLEPVCKYFYTDGTVIKAYSDLNRFTDEIWFKTKESRESLKKFFNYSRNIFDLTADLFLFNSPKEPKTFLSLNAVKTLFQIHKIDSLRTVHRAVSSFFKDKRIIQLFDRYATYNGSNPFEAPATLNIIPYVEYNPGSFLPVGGIYKLTEALFNLAKKKGVQFHFNSKVEEITLKDKVAIGIKVNGQELHFDSIISNADVNYTFKKLLKGIQTSESRRYSKLTPSYSGLVFYWGIDGVYEELETHNIIFSDNYQLEFKQLSKERRIPEDPTIYIYISSKLNSDDAPVGKENWFVMVNAPYNYGQDWVTEISKAKGRIIKKINSTLKTSIESKILFEETLTPIDIETQTSSYLGSIYGISSDTRKAAFLRQSNKSKTIKNLYFCGGSAHPGGGIPLVILSGKIVAKIIQKDLSK